jgi:TolB-like protein
MPEGVEGSRGIENADVLIVGVVGYFDLPGDRRRQALDELDRSVRSGTRFRVADVAGKVLCCPAKDGLVLAFFGDAEAAIECAMEIAVALKDHPEIKLRMGMQSGPVTEQADAEGGKSLTGAGIGLARDVMNFGDAGHILLSKRIAYDLAPVPRWNAHLYELGDCETGNRQNLALVNFYTDEIGNRETPTKVKRARQAAARMARLRRWRRPISLMAAAAIFLMAAIAGFVLLHRHVPKIAPAQSPGRLSGQSIAVLPFFDLSPGRDQEYFCDGVSDEIREMLAEIKDLQVIARTSSLVFKGSHADLGEAAQKLDVKNFLKGSLRRDGSWVRVSAQLVNARSGIETWSKTYDGQLSELPAVEDQVAGSVANVLKLGPPITPRARPAGDTRAYDLYLQGLFLSHKNSEDDLRAGLDFFRLALSKNPHLGPAFTGTARIWLRLAGAFIPPLNAYPQAQLVAEKALALNRDDAEAHVFLGETKRIFDWDLNGEEAELRRALEIDPNSVPAHLLMARLKTDLGDPEESFAHMREAVRLDPLSPLVGHLEVKVDVANDRLNEALAATKRTMDIDPDYTYFEPDLALVYREQGRLRQGLDIYLRLEKTRHQVVPGLAITYARMGKKDEARKTLDKLIQMANTRYVPAEQIASVFVALGDKEEAFRWLDRAVNEHSATIHDIGPDRDFRALRSDPRFSNLLRRIGLDPAKFRSQPPHP